MRTAFKTPAATALLFAATIITLGYTFWWGLTDLSHAWNGEEYSHGYFLPILALLMGIHTLSKHPLPTKPSWLGTGSVAIGLLLLVIGELSAFRQLAHYGFYVSLLGAFLTYFGKEVIRETSAAWTLLLFAIPLPVQITNSLSLKLKLVSSRLGAIMLETIGVPVFQDGNVIDLGAIKLQVVDACSGLNYLFPLMSLGFLIAYLFKGAFWKRAVIFLSTIPITILLNAFRIAIVGVTVNIWGAEMAEGILHDFEGWIVFVLCFLVLWAIVSIFLKTDHNSYFDFKLFSIPKRPFLLNNPHVSYAAIGTFIILLAGAISTTIIVAEKNEQNAIKHQRLSSFPLVIENWQGRTSSLDTSTLKVLDLTEYWLADYVSPSETEGVNLYIAYYATQKMGSTIHSPATCLPGGGWEIESIDEIPLDRTQGLPANVARMIVRKGMDKQLIYYWFNQGGYITSNRLLVKKHLFMDSLLRKRVDGALIRLTTHIAKTEKQENAEKRLQVFMKDVHHIMNDYLPIKESAR